LESFISCHCCERNFHYLNWLSTRICGAGRPQVGLCPAHLVSSFSTRNLRAPSVDPRETSPRRRMIGTCVTVLMFAYTKALYRRLNYFSITHAQTFHCFPCVLSSLFLLNEYCYDDDALHCVSKNWTRNIMPYHSRKCAPILIIFCTIAFSDKLRKKHL